MVTSKRMMKCISGGLCDVHRDAPFLSADSLCAVSLSATDSSCFGNKKGPTLTGKGLKEIVICFMFVVVPPLQQNWRGGALEDV